MDKIIKDDWITQKEILKILCDEYDIVISSRKLQIVIKQTRADYKKNQRGKVIIKSNKGYKYSDDLAEIHLFGNEMIKTGLSMVLEGIDFLNINKGVTK